MKVVGVMMRVMAVGVKRRHVIEVVDSTEKRASASGNSRERHCCSQELPLWKQLRTCLTLKWTSAFARSDNDSGGDVDNFDDILGYLCPRPHSLNSQL